MISESPDDFASWMTIIKALNRSHFQRLRRIQENVYIVGPPSFHLQGRRGGFQKPSFLSMSQVRYSQVRVKRDGVGLCILWKGPKVW